MQGLRAIARYIAERYPRAKKVVEVGVGRAPGTAAELSRLLPSCRVVATDVREVKVPAGVKFLQDDVTRPNLRVYKGASLIYSIHPPPELQPYLLKVARAVGADLLLKPLAGESVPVRGGKLVNYRRTAFYVIEFNR